MHSKNKIKQGLAARRVALDALQAVLEHYRPLEQALAAQSAYEGLDLRDRAFCRALCACVLRRMGQLDAVIDAFMKKTLPPEKRRLRLILRLSAAQSLYFGTPLYAVAGLSADLTREQASTRPFRPLVHALCRAMAEKGQAIAEVTPLEHNFPVWLRESWSAAYGEKTLQDMAEIFTTTPPLDVTVKNPEERTLWAERLEADILPCGTLRRVHIGDVTALAGYEEGAWWVQDAAASLPVRLLSPVAGETILDACAAPGGKTLQIAASGAEVVALDRSEKRLALVKDNLHRTGLSAKLVHADACSWQPAQGLFDAILLDAPCTATGTFRRHPDVVWTKQPLDVYNLVQAQRRLIINMVTCLRPGGRLIVSLCSLQPEEGAAMVEQIQTFAPDLVVDPFKTHETEAHGIKADKNGSVQTMPFLWKKKGGMDGFFIVCLRKICS